jgi:hypothetical protein
VRRGRGKVSGCSTSDLLSQERNRDRSYPCHHRRRVLGESPLKSAHEQSANARIARINILTIWEYVLKRSLMRLSSIASCGWSISRFAVGRPNTFLGHTRGQNERPSHSYKREEP